MQQSQTSLTSTKHKLDPIYDGCQGPKRTIFSSVCGTERVVIVPNESTETRNLDGLRNQTSDVSPDLRFGVTDQEITRKKLYTVSPRIMSTLIYPQDNRTLKTWRG